MKNSIKNIDFNRVDRGKFISYENLFNSIQGGESTSALVIIGH